METDIQETNTTEEFTTAATTDEAPLGNDLAQLDELIREANPERAKEMGLSGSDDTKAAPSRDTATEKTETETENGKPKAESENAEGKGEKTADDSGTQTAEKEEEKGSKWAKERERANRTWGQINAEKERLAADRKAFETERDELRARVQKMESAQSPRYTPEDYRAVATRKSAEAQRLESQGDFEGAQEARELAQAAEAKAQEVAKQPPEPSEAQLNQKRLVYLERAKTEVPEIMSDREGPVAKIAQSTYAEVLQAEPSMRNNPILPLMVARFAKAQSTAARVPELETEISRLTAKVKELTEATTPGGGRGPGEPPPRRTFEEMSQSERLADLEAMAAGRA